MSMVGMENGFCVPMMLRVKRLAALAVLRGRFLLNRRDSV